MHRLLHSFFSIQVLIQVESRSQRNGISSKKMGRSILSSSWKTLNLICKNMLVSHLVFGLSWTMSVKRSYSCTLIRLLVSIPSCIIAVACAHISLHINYDVINERYADLPLCWYLPINVDDLDLIWWAWSLKMLRVKLLCSIHIFRSVTAQVRRRNETCTQQRGLPLFSPLLTILENVSTPISIASAIILIDFALHLSHDRKTVRLGLLCIRDWSAHGSPR